MVCTCVELANPTNQEWKLPCACCQTPQVGEASLTPNASETPSLLFLVVLGTFAGAASAAVSLHASGGGGKSDSTGPERLMEGAIDDFADLC
eukprot:scaffold504_cov22-Tisochrysis_lutea.AAC.1